jgi:preprotein translocase subunit SecA
MNRLGMEEGEPIEHNMISNAIERAQAKVEGHNFEIRKHLLEYDDVMNQQREVIYRHRREALTGKNLKPDIEEMIMAMSEDIADDFSDDRIPAEEWDFDRIREAVYKQFNFRLDTPDEDTLDGLNRDGLAQMIYETALDIYNTKEQDLGGEDFRFLERMVMLQVVDNLWKDHLLSMDHLKEGIGLRGYAQQNPLIVYKKEGYEMFQEMINRIKEETLGMLFRLQIEKPEKMEKLTKPKEQEMFFSGGEDAESKKVPVQRKNKKIGRNDPCPCGSGKKYKKCCGR